ncbi:MAG: hypothetical protein HY896_10270 [Deltaproteobacteria bacterium]|nr:hypothetical protein [Deltaproteobacteria bacterium]
MLIRRGMTKPFRRLALAALIFLLPAIPAISAAEDAAPNPEGEWRMPADDTAPANDNVTPFADNTAPAMDNVSGIFMRTVDERHSSIERSILDRVVRFDNFFGSVKTENVRLPEYLIRWQNSLRFEEGNHVKYRTNVRAGFTLPKINKRLRLVVTGESEAEPAAARLPEDPGNPGFDRTLPNTRIVNTELRYGFFRTPALDIFAGAGVRVKRPFETFARTRLQYTRKLGELTLFRLGETLFWKNTEKLGETTEIDLERQLTPTTLLRWSNAGTLAQETRGLEWGTELSLLRALTPRSAVTLSGGVFGVTDPDAQVETYRILARYRRNFLRPWLFYELEPEMSWPRQPDGKYRPTDAFTVRLEIVFQGKEVLRQFP